MINFLYAFILLVSQSCLAKQNPAYEIIDLTINNNLPMIQFQIEDKKVELLFDTGARNQSLVLEKNILAKLKTIIEFKRQFKSTDITGKEYIAKKYILPKFAIGNINFSKVEVSEDTNWGLKSGNNLFTKDGVIGLELFTDKAIIIDYPNKKLVIINKKYPNEYDIDRWQKLDYKIDRFGLSIYTSIDGDIVKRFILDTGSNISIIKPSSVGKSKVMYDCNAQLSPNTSCSYIKSNKLSLKGIDYKGIFFYLYNFKQPIADGILGYDFLADKIIYIDFDKRIMKIKNAN